MLRCLRAIWSFTRVAAAGAPAALKPEGTTISSRTAWAPNLEEAAETVAVIHAIATAWTEVSILNDPRVYELRKGKRSDWIERKHKQLNLGVGAALKYCVKAPGIFDARQHLLTVPAEIARRHPRCQVNTTSQRYRDITPACASAGPMPPVLRNGWNLAERMRMFPCSQVSREPMYDPSPIATLDRAKAHTNQC